LIMLGLLFRNGLKDWKLDLKLLWNILNPTTSLLIRTSRLGSLETATVNGARIITH
jgi:hypothetical protein